MKIEKKMVEIETVTFEEKDVAIVEEAFNIIATLVGKISDIENCSDVSYEATTEEDKILDMAERIHRQYVSYEDSY